MTNRFDEKDNSKLTLMELMYAFPVTDFQRHHQLHAGIVGEEDKAITAFMTLFNLGQTVYIEDGHIYYGKLEIQLFTPSGEKLAQRITNDMPGMSAFPEYATVCCKDMEKFFEEEFLKLDYRIDCRKGFTVNGKRTPLYASEELERLNLNQKYANLLAKGNSVSFSEAKKSRENERIKDRYNYESSFACTAHMPVRLSLFDKDHMTAVKEMSKLLNAAEKERLADLRYLALVSLEHRRWNAYMIADGFQSITREEFLEKAFRIWPDHKDKKGKLHPCICDGGEDPFYLRKHPEIWNDEKFEERDDLSDLDKLSIRCRNLCARRAKEKEETICTMLDALLLKNKALENYYAVCRRIINDPDCKEDFLYKCCKADALTIAGGSYREEIKEIDQLLSIFRTRNAKKDFALLDRSVIDAMAFDLWHGKKYQTVITVCSGDAVRDVLLPFILTAGNAIFLSDTSITGIEQEQLRIRDFFRRRDLGEPVFHHVSLSNPIEIRDTFLSVLPENVRLVPSDEIAFNYVDEMPTAAVLEFVRIGNWYENIAQLKVENGEVINLRSGETINRGVHKGITVEEYLRLCSSEYTNYTEARPSFEEYDALKEIFQYYSKIRRIENNGSERKINIWGSMASFFEKTVMNTSPKDFFGAEIMDIARKRDREAGANAVGKISNLVIEPELSDKIQLDRLLEDFKIYRIIDDYQGDANKEGLTIIAPDQVVRELFYAIAEFSKIYRDEDVEVRVAPTVDKKEPYTLLDTKGRKAKIYLPDEKEDLKLWKVQMIKDLETREVIKNFDRQDLYQELTADATCSFEFSNLEVKKMLQSPGRVFEMVLFNQFRNAGLFEDVQTGVKIAWDDTGSWNFLEQMKNYFDQNPGCGKTYFTKVKELIRDQNPGVVENELDVILMKNLKPTFISCKI